MKRILLLFIVAACFSGRAHAAAAFVQEKDCHWFGGSGTSETCAFGSNVTAGNAVVVIAGWNNPSGSTISSVADLNSAAYSNTAWASGATNCASAANYDSRLYSLPNSAGGANASSVKVTWGADPGAGSMTMWEFSGVATSSMVDGADCQHVGTSVTSINSPSITTTGADALGGWGFDTNFNTRTWTAGTNVAWTIRGTTNSWFGQQSFIQTTGAAVASNITINTSDAGSSGAIFALKPAGAATVKRRRGQVIQQ